jgi:hypothetical protein
MKLLELFLVFLSKTDDFTSSNNFHLIKTYKKKIKQSTNDNTNKSLNY